MVLKIINWEKYVNNSMRLKRASLHKIQSIHFSLCRILYSQRKHSPLMFHWIQCQFWKGFSPVKCTYVSHLMRSKVEHDTELFQEFAFWCWTVNGNWIGKELFFKEIEIVYLFDEWILRNSIWEEIRFTRLAQSYCIDASL